MSYHIVKQERKKKGTVLLVHTSFRDENGKSTSACCGQIGSLEDLKKQFDEEHFNEEVRRLADNIYQEWKTKYETTFVVMTNPYDEETNDIVYFSAQLYLRKIWLDLGLNKYFTKLTKENDFEKNIFYLVSFAILNGSKNNYLYLYHSNMDLNTTFNLYLEVLKDDTNKIHNYLDKHIRNYVNYIDEEIEQYNKYQSSLENSFKENLLIALGEDYLHSNTYKKAFNDLIYLAQQIFKVLFYKLYKHSDYNPKEFSIKKIREELHSLGFFKQVDIKKRTFFTSVSRRNIISSALKDIFGFSVTLQAFPLKMRQEILGEKIKL